MSKPYLNLKDQIKHLKTKNIYIGNKATAKRILTRVNFQRFLAYRLHFLDASNNIKAGTKLKHIYLLYEFDKELRALTSPMLESIELSFRRHIAYELGSIGIHSYLNNLNFRDPFKHSILLNSINKSVNNPKDRKIISNHIKNYQDFLPIYKVVEILSFGELSKLFENLKSSPARTSPTTPKDKILEFYKKSKKIYSLNNKTLESWLRELVEVRNKCAHYDMLWDYERELKSLKRDPAWINGAIIKNTNKYKFYGVCLIFKYLCLSKTQFQNYMYNFEKLVKKYSTIINMSALGFPNTWKNDLF